MDFPASRNPTANNFGALRLLGALVVLGSHHASIFGLNRPYFLGVALGDAAVMMFFVMSGYLVPGSWVRDPHLVRFVLRRALRLWPGILVATMVIVLLGAAVTTLDLGDYFARDVRRFIAANLQLKPIYVLPGVFSEALAPSTTAAVNGSWWTLPIDVKCYGYFIVLAGFGLRRKWISVLALLLAAVVLSKAMSAGDSARQLEFSYIVCFFGGLSVRQFRDSLACVRLLAVVSIVTLTISFQLFGAPFGVTWYSVTALTIWTGVRSFPVMRSATRFGDLSFGVYLYGFFVQQTTLYLWPGPASFAWSLLAAAVATLCCAWVSWRVVERPALSLRSRLTSYFPDRAV